MSCRKPCKECPWKNHNPHSLKFRTYLDKMATIGKVEGHKCHMISKDVWGYQSEVSEKNMCIGQKQSREKL